MLKSRLSAVALAILASILAAVAINTADVGAAPRSRGTFFVFDSPDCTGRGNTPRVTVPFSIGGRNYPPNTALDIYATDKATNEVFGPFVVITDANGDFCGRVDHARPTRWKIDLVEPGNGSTDSKVITVLTPPATTTTTAAATTLPTTTLPTTTSSIPATSTTSPTTSTTVSGSTSTTASPGSTSPDTSTSTTIAPETEPPFEVIPVPVPLDIGLPGTGSPRFAGDLSTTAGVAIILGTLAVLITRRRPKRV